MLLKGRGLITVTRQTDQVWTQFWLHALSIIRNSFVIKKLNSKNYAHMWKPMLLLPFCNTRKGGLILWQKSTLVFRYFPLDQKKTEKQKFCVGNQIRPKILRLIYQSPFGKWPDSRGVEIKPWFSCFPGNFGHYYIVQFHSFFK